MTNRVCAWISYGQFGVIADPPSGERRLVSRLKAIGVNTMESPYLWSDTQKIAKEVDDASHDVKIVIGGDSLGDNSAVLIANAVKRDIHLLFGFQRSAAPGTAQATVPANVVKAIEIHDPNIFTDPFGDAPWVAAPGNHRTDLRNIAIDVAHPGDFGQGQDIIFNAIRSLL